MIDEQWKDEEFVSVFGLAAMFLRGWRRIARWALLGALLSAPWVLGKALVYTARASFVPESTDATRTSGLASLAGQFGVQLPASGQSLSPDFYVKLLESTMVLRTIARDTLTVGELDGARVAVSDLLEVKGATPVLREEKCIMRLRDLVEARAEKPTGIVSVSVATRWPSASNAIVRSLVDGVNEFNLRTRQGQATAERKFVEARLGVAERDLREAEDRLEASLKSNRQIAGSPELQLQRERLQRSVSMKQAVYTSLAQSYEQVRLREVRDTPVISMLESPSLPVLPSSRGRIVAVLTGLALGTLAGLLVVYGASALERRRRAGEPDATDLVSVLAELRREVVRRAQAIRPARRWS